MRFSYFFILLFISFNTSEINSQNDSDIFYFYDNEIPDGFYFKGNIGGPFSISTKYRFGLPDTSFVKIKIYNIDGIIKDSINTRLGGGNYIYNWMYVYSDIKKYKSGIYIILFNAEPDRSYNKANYDMKFSCTTKIIIVR